MANRFYSDVAPGKTKGNPAPTRGRKKAGPRGEMPEKPAFPNADLPGKSQPKDRSGGTKRAQVSPNRKGL